MRTYLRKQLISSGLMLFTFILVANAQEFRGSLTGKITDPNHLPVANAEVALKNINTNVSATTTTNETGVYTFSLVQPGKYTLIVTTPGFKKEVHEGIELNVADKLTLDVELEVGGIENTVTVVATNEVFDTGTVATGSTVNSRQISELPLIDGSPYQLATLAPGIMYTGNPAFYAPTSNSNLAAFRSNGATGPNQITLDSSPNYAIDGAVGFSPPSDSVQEFKIQTSAFDAQQGYTAGGTVNVAIKSGTNDLHGAAFYYNRARNRASNNFFSNLTGQDKPERTYHRYSGTLTGPVFIPKVYNGRSRTFFLVAYERLKSNDAEPQLFTVPTAAMRRGDFSALLNLPTPTLIYDPASAPQTGTGNFTRTPFAGNIIPTGRLNPVSLAYLSLFPEPNTTGNPDGTLNYFSPMNRSQNYRSWITRIDHNFNSRQMIFGKYYHSFNPEDRYNWAGVVNGFPITSGFEYRTNDGGNIDYTHTVSNSFIFDLRFSLARFVQERRPAEGFDPAQLGFTDEALATMRGYQYFPRFDIRTYDQQRPVRSTLGSNRSDYNAGRLRPFYVFSAQPTITQTHGDHTFRYGYDLRVLRENFISNGYQGGRYFFDGRYTSRASNSSSTERNTYGRDVASFLLGIPSASTSQSLIDSTSVNYSVQSLYHGFFFQDDWRVTRKLTVNLGLRYEIELGLTERFDRVIVGFDRASPSPIQAQAQTAYTAAYNANPSNFPLPPSQFQVLGGYLFANSDDRPVWDADKSNWQPRIGASYQLNEKTVLRGGFGIFMAPFRIEPPLQTGFSGSTPFNPTNDNGRTFIATLNDPFPSGLLDAPGSSNGLLQNVGQDIGSSTVGVRPADRRNAKFSRLVFGVQRELPGHFVVEADYVSSWGYDLAVLRNLNFVPRNFLGADPVTDATANAYLSTTIPNPFRNLLPNTGSPFNTASTITRAQSLLAYPQFTNVWVEEHNGTNRYHALQLQINKRFSNEVTLNFTYTYSKLRERINYLNPSDTELEDRLSTDDRPNRFTLAAVYLLPIGRNRRFGTDMNRVLDAFVGGWQLNGTYEWQQGQPFLLSNPLYYDGDVTKVESHAGQANGAGEKFGIRPLRAFDTSGFVRLSSFGIRNVPTTLDNLRNMPFQSVNLSLTKNFSLGENRRLQFRMEALNAFNHPYFIDVNLDPNNSAFGFFSTQRNLPRDIQLGVKFVF